VENFPRGTILVRAREPLQTVYIQLTGKSMIYNLTHIGKRKIIFVFGPGALLNEHVLNFHDASLYCETIEASRIFVIPCAWFLEFMEKDFSLARAVLEAQERKMWRMGHQLKNTMGSIYMERKLAAKLWKLSRDFGKMTPDGIEIDIRLTITFLADMLGAPRETTSRLCKNLSEAGLIRMDKRRIMIINPEKLSHFYKTGEV
jgi:CRP-like cAMP-binding protein